MFLLMRRVIIDTNFLMIPYQFKVDIFSEFSRICHFNYELFVFEGSVNELRKITENQSGKDKKAAQLALKLVRMKNIGIIKSGGKDVDALMLENVDKDTIVATQDIILKKNLLKKGASVIILRQKKYLQLTERKLYK